jgi:5-methyltetrahydrofolate corrinoid/iron sulfur protein methyltransferase
MIIIGERINGTFTAVRQAIDQKDKRVVQELAKKQTEAGATYLDVNVGTAAADQKAAMQWLIETIQETCGTPLSLDSAIVDALDRNLMNVVAAAEMLMNKQIYSDSFLKAYAGAN